MSEEVLHWFTRARRFPRLIGKAPGGGAYPGGPYTMTQVIGAGAVFGIGQQTQSLWGQWGFWINNLLLVSATVVALFALRLFKPGGRDPLSTLAAVLRVAFGPRHGRYLGKRVALGRAHQARNRINAQVPVVVHPTPADPVVVSAASPAALQTPSSEPLGPQPNQPRADVTEDTVVAQLLAHVRTSE